MYFSNRIITNVELFKNVFDVDKAVVTPSSVPLCKQHYDVIYAAEIERRCVLNHNASANKSKRKCL